MSFVLPLGALAVLGAVWGVASANRSKEILRLRRARAQARTVLTAFSQTAMGEHSVSQIVLVAGEVVDRIFGTNRLLLIEEDEQGRSSSLAIGESIAPADGRVVTPAPRHAGGIFDWFPSNSDIVFAPDLSNGSGGKMNESLATMMTTCKVDVIMPLVHRGELLAVLGIAIGREPSDLDRELLRIFRLEVTAACANVHLHHEVSHLHSLVDEVNVATGLDLSLIPKKDSGRSGKFKWHGHYRSAEQAGSDFWGMYPLSSNRLLIVMGDSVGRRLAGAMVSASVKSCCDQVIADKGNVLDPAEILTILNTSLFRATHSALASCSVAILDPGRSLLSYANAGHQLPYRLRKASDGLSLSVLQGSGPLLGDLMDPVFQVHKQQLSNADSVVFLTDGLLAPRNSANEAYGHRRFHKLLKAQSTTDPKDISDAVLAALAAHSADEKLRDDQALLIIKWA